jgi:hypothetical protein
VNGVGVREPQDFGDVSRVYQIVDVDLSPHGRQRSG